MALKRKRSLSNSSPLSTSSLASTSTSRASQSPTPAPRPMGSVMDFEPSFPQRTIQWPSSPSQPTRSFGHERARLSASDLGSRTRKRFRDNRPDEETIHETTLSLLFSAARAPHPEPTNSQPTTLSTPSISKPQRSTLHAFWALPPPRPTLDRFPVFDHAHEHAQPRPASAHGPACEDCDGELQSDSMEIDDMGETADEFACAGCKRRVCGMCAVAGDERRCLRCVGVGGGW